MLTKAFLASAAAGCFCLFTNPQGGGLPEGFKLPQGKGADAISSMMGGGFIDFSEDLARPGTAVVFGVISKYNEGKKERVEGDLGFGGNKVVMSGTVFYKVECTGDIAVADAFSGDVKGKSQNVQFNLQTAKDFDGKERRQILSEPKYEFETPFAALFVLEREKGKKNYQVKRVEKLDLKGDKIETSAARKKATDHYGVNRRKADFVSLFDAYNSARDHKEKENVTKKLKNMVENRPKWQIVDTDSIAAAQLGAYEKRAKETIEEFDKESGAASRASEKPPGEK